MIIDGIVLATLFLSALIAFFRGFVREVLTLGGLVGALAAAYFLSPLAQPLIHGMFEGDPEQKYFGLIPHDVALDVATFAGIFLIVLILLTLAAHAISHGLHAVGLGALDRTLGVLFGLIRGALLILIFYLPFYFTAAPAQKTEWFKNSATLPIVDTMAAIIEPYIPRHEEKADKPESRDEEAQGFDRLDGLMQQALDPGKEPDIIAPDAANGYTEEQNQALDEVIGGGQ